MQFGATGLVKNNNNNFASVKKRVVNTWGNPTFSLTIIISVLAQIISKALFGHKKPITRVVFEYLSIKVTHLFFFLFVLFLEDHR